MSTIADLRALRRRSRAALRKIGVATDGPVYGRLVDAGRRVPVPPRVRVAASTVLLRRPWRIRVPVESLLLGAQSGWTAREFADRADDLLWPSTRLVDGPHVALLRQAGGAAGEPTDEEILDGPYGRLGRACLAAGGDYFGARDDAGIVAGARAFIARHRGDAGAAPPRPNQSRPSQSRPSQSRRGDPVLVAPVRGSDCYQVLDGHHRLALAVARGERTVPVIAKWLPVTTPLQDLLTRMSWLGGTRELYQPIEAPELRTGWTTVRRCTDRRDKMRAFLAERDLLPPATTSYLDVASCYGWFVAQLRDLGYEALGMERDPLAVPLGRAVYGLAPGAVRTGDAVELLRAAGRRWDVVSCFSLLHHFVLGRGSVPAEELLRLLDQATGRVLFLDTGQENEEWFANSLKGWDPSRIGAFLRDHASFDEIVDLGPDDDAHPPYENNYRRHLFACVRRS